MNVSTIFERRDALSGTVAALMVALTFVWGFNQVAIKVSNTGYSPLFSMVVRSAIGAVCVYAWCRWRGIRLFERDGSLLPGLVIGVLFAGEFALLFVGLDYTTAARGALMLNTMPFWVLVGGHFFLGERITAAKLAGLLLAFAGVALAFSDQLTLPDRNALLGDLMCLGGGMLWGAVNVIVKGSRLSRAPAEKTMLYQLAVSALIALPFIWMGGPLVREFSALATGSLIFQAVFVVAFTYMLWFWLMRRYPASLLSSFTFLSPVWGVLCGAVLLGEEVTWRALVALVLIGIGIVIVNRPARAILPA